MYVTTTGRQTITTKFLGPSNVRGSRIKASCERGSIVISWDHSFNSSNNHENAVKALLEKFTQEDFKKYGIEKGHGWDSAQWVGGWNEKNGGYSFVQVPDASIFPMTKG